MVVDLVSYVCEVGIKVGLGCGFVVGVFIVYVLGIINIDLVKYGFLFECFFNLECFFVFDIDMDFDDCCCGEMICYVFE